jgi:hypothetical protein
MENWYDMCTKDFLKVTSRTATKRSLKRSQFVPNLETKDLAPSRGAAISVP